LLLIKKYSKFIFIKVSYNFKLILNALNKFSVFIMLLIPMLNTTLMASVF